MGDSTKIDASRAGITFEQGALDAYIEGVGSNGEGPTDADRTAYYLNRYEEVKAAYRKLLIQREEAEARKMDESLPGVLAHFRVNYSARLHVVRELRRLGQVVNDPFVPLSKT